MSKSTEAKLVAPCGINCGGCIAYFGYTMSGKKRKHSCDGCWSRPRPCAFIKKKCEKVAKGKLRYCFECSDFPCEVLSILDTRYREKYGFSLVENLRYIQEYGVKEFLKLEKQRANLARKLQNPRLLQIHFHTFRHWKATMLCHQTNGNIYYVKKFLGHKNIRNTENYIHLAEVIFSNEKPEYTCEPARTVKEAKALIEKGFSYECEIDGVKLFKKVK